MTKTQFSKEDVMTLPIGIAPNGCNGTTIIVIDSAKRREDGNFFVSAYTSVIFPGTTTPMAFAARGIQLGNGGLLATNQVKLVLLSKQSIQINENVIMELPADGSNYLEFDCNGFRSINLKGNFLFSNSIIEPDATSGNTNPFVTASFEINTSDLNNILTTINITPFKIAGLDDFSFSVKNAVVDYSDLINPPGVNFPQAYQQLYGDNLFLWRGFYLQDVTVTIKSFSDSTAQTKPRVISAKNLILDELGVTGLFIAENVIPSKEGSANGWPFSIDKLTARFQLNRLTEGSLQGYIGIPLLGSDTLAYQAYMEQEDNFINYKFSVGITDSVVFKTPLAASVTLQKGSIVSIEKRGRSKILPSANLHGYITLNSNVKVRDIKFENLHLISEEPYVVSGNFSLTGKSQATGNGFPIQITDLALKVFQGQVAITVGAKLSFMNAEDKGFSADTRFHAFAKLEKTITNTGEAENSTKIEKQKWVFEKVKVDRINLNCKTMAFGLKGTLDIFDNDPVYGNGFHGSLNFTLKKVLENGVRVNAYFGSKDAFRYWHVDGYFPTGHVPIPPIMAITGFMGGASYKMVRQQPFVPDFSKLSETEGQKAYTESTNSQKVYVPDEKAGLGFMAGVTLVVANERAINADAMLEVVFNKGGGLRYIQFDGSAFFLTPIKARGRAKGKETVNAPVYATMNMLYDNDNDVFHANMKTFVNVTGAIRGIGERGMVGEAVIHIDRSDWYLYIGRPSAQFGVNLFGLANAQSYFMLGTKIENLPLPPNQVREIFKDIDLSLMRDDLAAAGGKGYASGFHFGLSFDTKDKIKPFYVKAYAGAGTDIMIRNYGSAQCVGEDGPIGVNGWYASGQAYAFLNGKIGLQIKRKDFDIVSLGLAALLQAKLPKPTWLSGRLAGNYKVLGGLVKGKFNLKFTVGSECELLNKGEEIKDIIVIADVKPDDASNAISVFSAPQVTFNTAIGKDFSMMDLNDNLNAYRIMLDKFEVQQNGQVIKATIQWNERRDVAQLKTEDILPPNSPLSISVKLHWEMKNSSGLWQSVTDNNNNVIYEVKSTVFETSDAPGYIPEENITYSYPINKQFNLYKSESETGYIKMFYPQEYLFKPGADSIQYDFFVRFRDNNGKTTEQPLKYSKANSEITFTFPSLTNQFIYTADVIKKSKTAKSIDENIKRDELALAGQGDNQIVVTNNKIATIANQSFESKLYSFSFRTSAFNTFKEKWTTIGNGNDIFDIAVGNVAVIGKRTSTSEVFDRLELEGNDKYQPLLKVKASEQNQWFSQIINPQIYEYYPFDSDVEIGWRNTDALGIKPLQSVVITNDGRQVELSDDMLLSGKTSDLKSSVLVSYFLSYYTFWDFIDLMNQVSDKYFDNWETMPIGAKRLFSNNGGYTDLLKGSYPVDVNYFLPGKTKPNFEGQLFIRF